MLGPHRERQRREPLRDPGQRAVRRPAKALASQRTNLSRNPLCARLAEGSYANVSAGFRQHKRLAFWREDGTYIADIGRVGYRAAILEDLAWLGFEADTLIINHGTKNTLLQSSTFAAPYIGDIASENLLYQGTLPQKIFNLDVLVSRQVPAGNAIIMQRHRAGFYADELPFLAGPLYRSESTKSWRSDTQRSSAIGLDQPLSVTLLSGV